MIKSMKSTIFWDVMPRSLTEVHSVSDEVLFLSDCLVDLLISSEDGDNTFSEMSLNFCWIIWLQTPEDIIPHSHHYENLNCSMVKNSSILPVLHVKQIQELN